MEQNDKPDKPKNETTSERLRRMEEEKNSSYGRFNEDGDMVVKLTINDSALVVRDDGTIEMISHELEKSEGGFIGDIEDLNKTFSLVLALVSALENEDLYNRIFHNLNLVLMMKWNVLDDGIKDKIIQKRRDEAKDRTVEEREDKAGRIDEFRKRMEKYKDSHINDIEEERRKLRKDIRDEENFKKKYGGDFEEFLDEEEPKKPKMKKKKKLLLPAKGTDWNPYDKTLKAHWKPWHADESPPEEDE